MDFVSLVVITDIDNWFGAFFELLLDAIYQEETIDNPEYLDFQTDSLSKVSSFFWVIFNITIVIALTSTGVYRFLKKMCPNLEYYQQNYD